MYGQRTGAMIGVSSDKSVIDEFAAINQYTSRATWSNINRPAMRTLATIYSDPELLAKVCAERDYYYQMIKHVPTCSPRKRKNAACRCCRM